MSIVYPIIKPRVNDDSEWYKRAVDLFSHIDYAGSPIGNITPRFLGDRCLDTTNKDWYVSHGTTSDDWESQKIIGDYDAGNYTEFESDGTMEMHGDATVWDDLRVSLITAKVPAANYPGFTQVKDDGSASTGVFAYHFADDEYVFFTIQMSHRWKLESTIWPHIHFMTTSDVSPADNFGIGLEYLWVSIGGTAGNTTVITRDISTGVNTLGDHQIANVSATGISGTGHGLSSILLCRLFRQAAVADNYAGDIIITDFDLHFEIDSIGSRGIVSK